MSQEMMAILIDLTGLVEDLNRAIGQAGADRGETDEIRWAGERLRDEIYRLAREGV